MDELEFRRRVYANPDTTDPDVVKAAQQDADKQAFWNELKSLNLRMAAASKVEVPDDLAHRLIWQQSVREFARHKRQSRWYIAMAASIAFTVGIGSTLWLTQPPADLSVQALVHMQYAESEQSHSALPVDLHQINAKLASFGAQLTSDIGEVKSANYCHLSTIQSLHLILQTDQGLMSVFVVPHRDNMAVPKSFANDQFHGEGFDMQKASILVVGDNDADLNPLAQKVTSHILFST